MKTLIRKNEANKYSALSKGVSSLLVASCFLFINQIASAQDSLPPPSLGDDTKGTPAVAETEPLPEELASTEETTEGEADAAQEKYGPLGQATITETRRDEGGQVYRVELEHSIGGRKQILEENDSDGQLKTRSTGLDEEVNIPKWRIGSW